MFSWKKAVVLSGVAVVSSCQMFTALNHSSNYRKVAQESLADVQYHDKLVDYTPYSYQVLFTDPVCGVYTYTQEVLSQSGKKLTQKPENVYCKNKYDQRRSGERAESPQHQLVEWINQPGVEEIFFTYLSFTNKAVKNALCEVAKKGVKINFVMSSTENKDAANDLIACNPENVHMKGRGMEGGLGFAHNKFFIINPHSKSEFKVVFSSGNMSSGPVIHHENWNFITTNPSSHFAQAHLCAMNAEWDDAVGRARATYIQSIKTCREAIKAPEEKDIKVFFVPGEGEPEAGVTKKTAVEYMLNGQDDYPGISTAKKIWLGCHRFFYNKMVNGLGKRMSYKNKPELRIVCDDDTFYKAQDSSYGSETMPEEYYRMQSLAQKGAQLKFMETNSEEHQLHHSKYLIFASYAGKPSANPVDDFKAVFTGSANLTGAGFNKNWENSYYITIPAVVRKFAEHYVHTWDNLATKIEDLPKQGVVGSILIDQPIIKKSNDGAK